MKHFIPCLPLLLWFVIPFLPTIMAANAPPIDLPKEGPPEAAVIPLATVPDQPYLIHENRYGDTCVHTEAKIVAVFERAWLHNIGGMGITAGDKGLGVVLEMPTRLVTQYAIASEIPHANFVLADSYLKNWQIVCVHSWQDYLVMVGALAEPNEAEWMPVTPDPSCKTPGAMKVQWRRVPVPDTPSDEMLRVIVLLHWDGYGDVDPPNLAAAIREGKTLRSWFAMSTTPIESIIGDVPIEEEPLPILPGPRTEE